MKKILLQTLIVLAASLAILFAVSGWVVGAVFEQPLERSLSRLFNVPVEIENLYIHLWPGAATADRITFYMQPEFQPGPHFDMRDVRVRFDSGAILDKRVEISYLKLNRPFFLIDRRTFPEGARNNVITWYRHAQIYTRRRDPGTKWPVHIARFEIENGTFIFQDRTDGHEPRIFKFQELRAELENLVWPVEDPSELIQTIWARGTFGERDPAPLWAGGLANFATSRTSFDLVGVLPDGVVHPENPFWNELPVKFKGGRYTLRAHVISRLKKLEADTEFKFRELQIQPRGKGTEALWGTTIKAVLKTMEQEKEMELRIPVRGTLAQPEFEFMRAFSESFQKAMGEKMKAGVQQIGASASKLAGATQELIVTAPLKAVGGVVPLPEKNHSQKERA
ncbi:MAG: hypothetical protein ACOY3K_06280 [Candidatus Omnitrophota bacterium]